MHHQIGKFVNQVLNFVIGFASDVCQFSRSEDFVLEFPEVTSSTRRDHWLALIKEIMFMHRFLSKYKVECPIQAWEMHARTILGIIRLHAARELLRISPPAPTKFLIFALFDELPKGDYILEELAENLRKVNSGHPCSASSILKDLNMSQSIISSVEVKEVGEENMYPSGGLHDNKSSLETVINQAREEEKDTAIAKATTEGLKEEGVAESALILNVCALLQFQLSNYLSTIISFWENFTYRS